jgi:hypothetical protein
MGELKVKLSGQNQGFLSAVVNENRRKLAVSVRSTSDILQYVNYLRDISAYSLLKISENWRYREGIILKLFQNQVSSHGLIHSNQGVD